MSAFKEEREQIPPQKKIPGEWAQQDLLLKSEILQALYNKVGELDVDDKERLIGFLASCLGKKAPEGGIGTLFEQAATKELSMGEFTPVFESLKPLDAKLIPLNCEAIGIKPWQEASKKPQSFPKHGQALLEEYMIDSDIPAALSFRNPAGQSIDIASANVYPIHSVAKVFTGVMALMMMHEKPDGKNSILSKDKIGLPIEKQLAPDVWALLPPKLQEHLENITLGQLMWHEGGLGDYGYDSGTGTYRDLLEGGNTPEISEIRDFLQFAEEKTYTAGEFHYSNLGITLVGLAVEHAYKTYQEAHPELSLPPLNYFAMLKHFILDKASMTNFFERAPMDPRLTVQTNPNDKAARAWVGGPAGGYWTTTEDLVKFGQWLHVKCQDPTFRKLVEDYGREFYKDGKISHPGNSPYASAFFFVDLETGNTAALGSTDASGVSLGLELTLGRRVFSEEKALEEDLARGVEVGPEVTQHYRGILAERRETESAPAAASLEGEERAKQDSPSPLQTTLKPKPLA